MRSYSLNEIGASRGAHLGFDHLGRIAVIGGQKISILNDNRWIDLIDDREQPPSMLKVVWAEEEGRYYFGSLATWGTLEPRADGGLEVRERLPEQFPRWVQATNFSQIVSIPGGRLFAGYYGIIVVEGTSGRQHFVDVPELVRVFRVGEAVYVSSHTEGLRRLDLESLTFEVIDAGAVVDEVAPLADGRVLASTTSERLLTFDGRVLEPWASPLGEIVDGSVSCLAALASGGVAIAIDGKGVFVFSAEGEVVAALTTTEYHRIFDLATCEDGILWLTTESTLQKVFYDGGISIVDQRSGVVVAWPKVVPWREGVSIASHGRLYDMRLSADGVSYAFEPVERQPPGGVWGVGANATSLLVGSPTGVYEREDDGFRLILGDIDTTRVVMAGPDLCYVLGTDEIAVLRHGPEGWFEGAPRVPGVGFPSVIHFTGRSVWIELGKDLAARVRFVDGHIEVDVFDEFDWPVPQWVNIGTIGDLVVLSGWQDDTAT
ncbi:MAG: hypothetical protein ACLFU2_14685, partial [Opitutales bacterium]